MASAKKKLFVIGAAYIGLNDGSFVKAEEDAPIMIL